MYVHFTTLDRCGSTTTITLHNSKAVLSVQRAWLGSTDVVVPDACRKQILRRLFGRHSFTRACRSRIRQNLNRSTTSRLSDDRQRATVSAVRIKSAFGPSTISQKTLHTNRSREHFSSRKN